MKKVVGHGSWWRIMLKHELLCFRECLSMMANCGEIIYDTGPQWFMVVGKGNPCSDQSWVILARSKSTW